MINLWSFISPTLLTSNFVSRLSILIKLETALLKCTKFYEQSVYLCAICEAMNYAEKSFDDSYENIFVAKVDKV